MVHGVADEQLEAVVAAHRSWRAVLQAVGKSSPRVGRDLRARCDELGIDYQHFRSGPADDVVQAAVEGAHTWAEAVAAAGYAEESGSARAQLRKRCSVLGLSTEHLDNHFSATPGSTGLVLRSENLRVAGPAWVAAHLMMAGCRVSWPLEPAPYDLVIEDADGIRRVQVKTSTRRAAGGWECGLTRSVYDGAAGYCIGGQYMRGEIDAFAVVDGDLWVYLIPFAVLEGRRTIQVRKYDAYRLHLPARPAAGIR